MLLIRQRHWVANNVRRWEDNELLGNFFTQSLHLLLHLLFSQFLQMFLVRFPWTGQYFGGPPTSCWNKQPANDVYDLVGGKQGNLQQELGVPGHCVLWFRLVWSITHIGMLWWSGCPNKSLRCFTARLVWLLGRTLRPFVLRHRQKFIWLGLRDLWKVGHKLL